jgi:hypothetical protein
MRLLIARVCGHYTYDDPAVKAARRTLYANLDRFGMIDGQDGAGAAERFVTQRVRDAIAFYIRHFRMNGVNAVH